MLWRNYIRVANGKNKKIENKEKENQINKKINKVSIIYERLKNILVLLFS